MLTESYLLEVANNSLTGIAPEKLTAICYQAIQVIELVMENARLKEELEKLAMVGMTEDGPDVFHRVIDGEDTMSGDRELECGGREDGDISEVLLLSLSAAKGLGGKPCPKCFPQMS
ncbi:MAG: hypothetical protein Q8Q12_00640 [bacterium]|nr:hypothetical protein [bacterium]